MLIPDSVDSIFPFSLWLTKRLDVLTLVKKTSFGQNSKDIVCAITLENKHRGTWGIWKHLLALLGWQHRVALQSFLVEKHYLVWDSLLWVTLVPFKQWEVRTIMKLKTCFIRTRHCSTIWRAEKTLKKEPGETSGKKNWTFEWNNCWCLSSGIDILTKSVRVFSRMFFARWGWEESTVCSFVLEPS